MKLIFEKSRTGRSAYSIRELDVPETSAAEALPADFLRQAEAELPEVSEVDAIRHYTALSRRNHGVDTNFYPLGSCTMKYNPKINEDVAGFEGFSAVHPLQPEYTAQGCLQILHEMNVMLSEITGMDRFTLQPAAGAHGELTGLMMMKAYHQAKGSLNRNKIIIPDSAHGTNPASAAAAGFEVIEIKSGKDGLVDLDALRLAAGEDTAGLMLTNPNTLGLFEENIREIADIVHSAGGLLYYDGANANAILGITRPGDMGFDVVHLNLHKTFATPHGGGGPGSGPVGVKKELVPYLPCPTIEHEGDSYFQDYDRPLSIGRVKAFYGNFGVILKAYAYIRSIGAEGLRAVSEGAVLNANYLLHILKDYIEAPYGDSCMHEFVLSGQKQKDTGVSTMDIAKRLMEFGYHPPTVYFPLIVRESMMIEPTETESKETLDEFAEVLIKIIKEASYEPQKVTGAPANTVISRPDETKAARNPILRWAIKNNV